MTYSQINHTKVWGFSRRTPNLNLSLLFQKVGFGKPKGIRGASAQSRNPQRLTTSICGGGNYATKIQALSPPSFVFCLKVA